MYPYISVFSLSISTYFLVISLAVTLTSLWFLKLAERRSLPRTLAIDFNFVFLVCGFAGARLLHVVFEEPDFYSSHPLAILEFWNGGFVFYGGMAGACLGTWLFCLWHRQPFFFWADTATLPISLAYILGRLACFLNGCCYGRECHLPWSVEIAGVSRHPTQLYASLWELAVFGLLRQTAGRMKAPGTLFSLWLLLHAVGRMVMETFRDDPRGNLIAGYSLGSWISLGLIVMSVGLLISRGSEPDKLS